jgi:hypothetical protein
MVETGVSVRLSLPVPVPTLRHCMWVCRYLVDEQVEAERSKNDVTVRSHAKATAALAHDPASVALLQRGHAFDSSGIAAVVSEDCRQHRVAAVDRSFSRRIWRPQNWVISARAPSVLMTEVEPMVGSDAPISLL